MSEEWAEEDTVETRGAVDFVVFGLLSLIGGLIGGMLMVVMVLGE